jgi:hypothetical protein
MDIPVASSLNELEKIFSALEQSNESGINGLYLLYLFETIFIFFIWLIFYNSFRLD